MKRIIKSITRPFHWIVESDRLKHIKYGFYAGLCGTVFAAIGAGQQLSIKINNTVIYLTGQM